MTMQINWQTTFFSRDLESMFRGSNLPHLNVFSWEVWRLRIFCIYEEYEDQRHYGPKIEILQLFGKINGTFKNDINCLE